MSHEIKADSDNNTYVGYNFITKEFYVRNLDTKTAAKSAYEAKLILDITAPGNHISGESIALLASTYEPVEEIHYVLEDSGRYIKCIYFNDYKSFAMQYDEPNLYIRGSNEMWDMSSTISTESVELFMWQYFVYYLGLNMKRKLINAIIQYYKKLQTPYVYNTILTQTKEQKDADEPLMYSNTLLINNANGTSRGEYSCVKNPDNLFTLNQYTVTSTGTSKEPVFYGVNTIEKGRKRINLTSLYDEGTFVQGEKIRLQGTEVEGLDGDYTIAEQKNDPVDPLDPTAAKTHILISEDEEFVANFLAYYTTDVLLKLDESGEPESTDITDNIITCKEEPDCQIGDTIQVTGTKYIENLTVAKVEKNLIYTNEHVPVYSSEDVGFNPDTGVGTTQVWINAYGVIQCGFDNYIEIKSAQNVSKTDVANRRIYVRDILNSNDYVANEKVYLNIGGNSTEFIVESMTPSTYSMGAGTAGPAKFVEGWVTVTTAPPEYTYHLGSEVVYLEKHNDTKVPENSFKLSGYVPLVKGDTIEILNTGEANVNGTYKIESVDGKKIYIERENNDKPLPEYSFDIDKRGIAQIRVYSERILLNMTYSKNADKMPMGSFMLDNNQQLTEYLKLYRITTPTSQNYADLNQLVNMKYYLGDDLMSDLLVGNPTNMVCEGLYSDNYKDK